jgi:hypothetical protein
MASPWLHEILPVRITLLSILPAILRSGNPAIAKI